MRALTTSRTNCSPAQASANVAASGGANSVRPIGLRRADLQCPRTPARCATCGLAARTSDGELGSVRREAEGAPGGTC
jgi:hypothetical protein